MFKNISAFITCAIILSPLSALAGGAVYRSDSKDYFYYSYDYTDLMDAEVAAADKCRDAARDCKYVFTYTEPFLVIYSATDGAWGAASNYDYEEAVYNARSSCENHTRNKGSCTKVLEVLDTVTDEY